MTVTWRTSRTAGVSFTGELQGGSEPVPEQSLTPPSLESGMTLAAANVTDAFTVTNESAENPCVVALSDSLGYLDFLNPHDGTATFAIESGGSVDVSLKRTVDVPATGGPWTTTVSALLANGAIVTEDVIIEAAANVTAFLAALANGHAWDCSSTEDANTLTDNATGLTPAHAAFQNLDDTNVTIPSAQQGVFGELAQDNDAGRVRPTLSKVETAYTVGNPWTWVVVFNVHTALALYKRLWDFYNNHLGDFSPGQFHCFGASNTWKWEHRDGPWETNTGFSHSDGGASEALKYNVTGLACVAVSWDGVGNTKLMWKGIAGRTGHSYRSEVALPAVAPADETYLGCALGNNYNANSARVTWYGAWWSKVALSAAQFNQLLDIVGLGGTA